MLYYVDRDSSGQIIAVYGSEQYPGQETITEEEYETWSFQVSFDSVLSNYRDSKSEINVTYDNGVDEYTVFNNERTRAALQQKMNRLQNTPVETVNFETVNGFFELGLSDISGLFVACDTRQQACFDAAKVTKEQNDISNFSNENDMKSFFDNQL